MHHINHSVAAAFLQDVWLDWLRRLQEHNAAQQWEGLLTGQNSDQKKKKTFKIFYCKQRHKPHKQSAVSNKDTGRKNKRKWSQFVSKRSLMWRKRPSSWMINIFRPLLAAPNNWMKQRRGSGFLQMFAQKNATMTFVRHPPASFTLLHLRKGSNEQSYSALTE